MFRRTQKQITVGLLSSLFFFGIFFVLLFLFKAKSSELPPPPPVSTGASIEPRANLADLDIKFAEFFEIRKFDTYDAVALVQNPNSEYGGREVRYEFIFYGSNGSELLKVPGKAFILPKQSRYIIEQAIHLPAGQAGVFEKPQRVELKVRAVDWQRLAPFTPFVLELSESNLARDEARHTTTLSGVVKNTSPYNLKTVEVQAALFDPKSGRAVAGGKTNMQDLLRDNSRFFEISWPYVLDRDLTIDVKILSNFFENSNFIREYGSPP